MSIEALALNPMYVLASRQMALNKNHDRIADTVANVNTTAYKTEKDIHIEVDKNTGDRYRVSFAGIGQTLRQYEQGPLIATGRQLDVAINGPGYFMVETPRGTRFTRAGNFKVTAEGVLTTKEGYAIVGAGGGRVEFAEQDVNIKIRDNGLVSAGAEERGQIGVFIFEDDQQLIREGESLYRTSQAPQIHEESAVVQGMLEGSNVNSVQAMTQLVDVSRNIEKMRNMQKQLHDLQVDTIKQLKQR